nr:gluconokinase-like [Ipomoea batatas]
MVTFLMQTTITLLPTKVGVEVQTSHFVTLTHSSIERIRYITEKMQNGIPLTDEDRVPWLETLRDALRASLAKGQLAVLACSALQNRYREILRSADPRYEQGSRACSVKFVLLDVTADVLAERLKKRAAEGKHFMPAKLLQSQLDLLQIDESEGIFKIDATLDPRDIVSKIQAFII